MGENMRKDVSNIKKSFPKFDADFKLPNYLPANVCMAYNREIFFFHSNNVDCCSQFVQIVEDRIFSTAFRMSSTGAQLWTHYDIMDNVLCNVVGQKRVVLFPPHQVISLEFICHINVVIENIF